MKLLDTHVSPLPQGSRRRSPLSHGAHSYCQGVGPRNSALCLCLLGRPQTPAQDGRRAEGAFALLSRRPLGPGTTPEPPAPVASSPGSVSGTEGDRPIPAPRAYLPVPSDGLAAGALRPSFSPFPPAASLLPPPAGWAPPPLLPDRSPARSPAAQRRGASGARLPRGWARRQNAEVGSGRGAEGRGCD